MSNFPLQPAPSDRTPGDLGITGDNNDNAAAIKAINDYLGDPAFLSDGSLLLYDALENRLVGGAAPGKMVGFAKATATQTGITTETDLIGLAVTVDVPADSRIRITGSGTVIARNGTSMMRGGIYEDGSLVQRWADTRTLSQDETFRVESSVVLEPLAGSHTYKLTLQHAYGTGNAELFASSGLPAFILVEELGKGPGSGGGGGGGTPAVHRTRTLLATTVPVTTTSSEWTQLYQVAVDVEPGDVVEIQSMAQLTNDLGYTIMYGCYVLRDPDPTLVGPNSALQVVRASADNITPDRHHTPRHAIGTDEITVAERVYYTFVAYCASSAATAGATASVDDYGELVAIVHR